MTGEKRFRVALSFPGEHREFVSRVADHLAERLGRERILYDKYYEAEFAQPNLDTYLQRLYHDESELIVVFVCREFNEKEWCGLEWRAVRDLIKGGEAPRVMPVRLDDTEILGLFGIDGYVSVNGRPAEEIAGLILERYELNPSGGTDTPAATPAISTPTNQRIAPSLLPTGTATLIGREEELAMLDEAWANPQTHVLSLVAWGGAGKTSLVGSWQAGLAARDFDGADYFDWSFYSQGTNDQSSASGDAFVSKALEFFGDPDMADGPADAWTKGVRLAQLVAQRRTLLILDGLEPLQHGKGPLNGELKDPAVSTLLKGLAGRNPGLCVVTTRVPIKDLETYQASTAPKRKLSSLSPAAGVSLLKHLGVHGSASDLEDAVAVVQGHALTLSLLGRFLAAAHGGDIRKRDVVNLREADDEVGQNHAFQVMEAYEKWFAAEGKKGERALAVLRLLGLFDRPATGDCLQALRDEPAIPGLTEPILQLSPTQWRVTVSRLRELGLLVDPPAGTDDGSLDAHPIIREHFASQLQKHRPEAWRAAHGRLYEHLRDTTDHQPDTLEGLQPLYQAVAHGCLAGRYQEASDKVYAERILRGANPDGFYSTKKLGAIGADLGAVACFFERPWDRVSTLLTETHQAWLLGEAATRLRAFGRLQEAQEPMQSALEMRVQAEQWGNAAVSAGNLSDLELTLGDLPAAVRYAKEAVAFADRNKDEFQRLFQRTTLADALHQAGQQDEARALFEGAEVLQEKRQPGYPLLYSLQGFRYCDLLLGEAEARAWKHCDQGRAEAPPESTVEVLEGAGHRATSTLKIAKRNNWLLDIALDHLTLGRARLYRAILGSSDPATAQDKSEEAVTGLRGAGFIDYIPKGLLTRAWLRALLDDEAGARADLDEAEDIARRGPMPLYLADIALHRARLFHDRAALIDARRLIEKHGYGRRRRELEDAEEAAKGWGEG